ncbi:MAG: hypothetical protein ACRD6B_15645 [Bryobacteraceae bacterium]
MPLLLLLVPCFLQAQALTNAQVTKMVQAKLSDQLIVNSIHDATAVKFDLSPNGLIALKSAGVSDAVIEAMQSRSSGHRSSEAKESAVNNTNGRFPADIGVFYVTPEGKYILLEEDDASAHMKVGSMIMGAEFFGKYKEEAKIPGPEAKVATDRLPHFLIHVPQRDVSKFQVMKVWEIRPNERVVFRFVGRVNFRVKGHEIASSLSTTAVPGYVEMTPEKTLSEGEYGIVDLADIDKRTAKIWSFKIR